MIGNISNWAPTIAERTAGFEGVREMPVVSLVSASKGKGLPWLIF